MYVTLRVMNCVACLDCPDDSPKDVQVEGAKAMKYAAKVVAEHLGVGGDDVFWMLVEADGHKLIHQDDIAANWDGRGVLLATLRPVDEE